MIILDDSKSLSVLALDTSNGKGQIECINPLVTENLNGSFELEFDCAVSEKYFSLLKVGGLLKCKANQQLNSMQMFRIYYISKAINGVVTVKAQHITYDLSGTVVKPFTATGASSAVSGMLTNVIGTTPFTMTTDITNTVSNFTLDIPRSFRECLGGYEGSLLDVFRGEYEWDNLTVKMLAHRGADNGVRIAYGKNLTDLTQEENNENVFDAVYGYAIVDDTFYPPSGIYNKTGATNPKVKIVDFSGDYQSGDTPSQADLYSKAQTYATNNDIEVPNVNIKVSFVPLWQTEEYKDILPLERVSLGDTVHVFFEKLGVTATARVIKTVWNINLNRYEEIELGSARANLNTVINDTVDSAIENAMSDIEIDTGFLEEEMFNMSKLIANGMGLHITKDSQGRIFLHNAEQLSQSQYQYQITSNGFMLSDDNGQTWNSGWDISGNAVVNSLATITLKFLQGYGMYMRFGDVNSNYIEVAPYSVNNVSQGVSFDGSGSIRMQPQNEFIVRNVSANDDLYNYLFMKHQSNQNRVLIENYWYDDPQYLANYIQLISNATNNVLSLNNKEKNSADNSNVFSMGSYTNANTLSMTNKSVTDDNHANTIELTSSSSNNLHSITFTNRKRSSSDTANTIFMQNGTSNSGIWLYNYQYDNTYLSTYVNITSTNTQNSFSVNNNKKGGNTSANSIQFSATSTSDIFTLSNYQKSYSQLASRVRAESDSTHNNLQLCNYLFNYDGYRWANQIEFESNGSVNQLNIVNYDANEVPKNYIHMKGQDQTMELWSANDLRLYSSGAVRVLTGNSQDIELTSNDDIHLNYLDKLYFNTYQIYIDSNGYVRATT